MSNITFHQSIRITATDPLLELDGNSHFRIRVVYMSAAASACAVAAVRCEDQREVHWLSEPTESPLEAVKMMMDGFVLASHADSVAHAIVQRLLSDGKASEVGLGRALAA